MVQLQLHLCDIAAPNLLKVVFGKAKKCDKLHYKIPIWLIAHTILIYKFPIIGNLSEAARKRYKQLPYTVTDYMLRVVKPYVFECFGLMIYPAWYNVGRVSVVYTSFNFKDSFNKFDWLMRIIIAERPRLRPGLWCKVQTDQLKTGRNVSVTYFFA